MKGEWAFFTRTVTGAAGIPAQAAWRFPSQAAGLSRRPAVQQLAQSPERRFFLVGVRWVWHSKKHHVARPRWFKPDTRWNFLSLGRCALSRKWHADIGQSPNFPTRASVGSPTRELQFGRDVAFPYIGRSCLATWEFFPLSASRVHRHHLGLMAH